MPYDDWGLLLSKYFPARDPAEALPDWEKLKQRLLVGQSVTGTVVARAPFGAWVDIGVGFAALILIPNIAGLTPERYRLDDWCPIGTPITAVVGIYNDQAQKVRLWQVNPEA
jgi:ribosomal protein S1